MTRSLAEVRERIEALAARIEAPAHLLPTYGVSEDFARPHIEADDRYHFVVVERGQELERRTTDDLGELLRRVFQSVVFSMACAYELARRRPGEDPRRLIFSHERELLAALDPAWAERIAAEQAATLARHPFADGGPSAAVDPTPPAPAWSAVLSVIILARDAAADVAALMRALVPAAMDGLVRELIVADPAPDPATAELCEDAGAKLVRGGLAEAAAAAKCELVLVAPADLRLPDLWMRRLGDALSRGVRAGVVTGEGERGLLAAFRPRAFAVLAPKGDAAAASDIATLRRRLGGQAQRIV
jgi:hypothetical protein